MMIDSRRIVSTVSAAMADSASDIAYSQCHEAAMKAYAHVIDMIENEVGDSDDGFDAAWDLYGYKENKVAARRSWKRLPKSTRQLIMDHIPKFKTAMPAWRTLPLFSTYLNQMRWEDEELPTDKKTELPLMTHNEMLRHAQKSGTKVNKNTYKPVPQSNGRKPLWKYIGK